MANPAQRGSTPDDDSWGKIASDLFGIQFNDDDDFELPDDEAPVAESHSAAAVTGSSLSSSAAEMETVAEAGFDEVEETAQEVVETDKKSTVPGNEDHDEFWDILESWNWDESEKTPPARRTDESQGRRSRQESGSSEPRRGQRDEPARRESASRREEPARRSETPRRAAEPTRAESPRPEVARGEEAPRREERRREQPERPRRRNLEGVEETIADDDNDLPKVREESRRERPPRTEQPPKPRRAAPADRPAAERAVPERPAAAKRPQAERRPQRPAENVKTRETASEYVGNDFGSGVEDAVETPRPKQARPVRKREDKVAPPPARRPVATRRPEPEDDFEGDLFLSDSDDEFIDEAVTSEPEESVFDSDDGESGPPRRRRRRRRRRGRSASDLASVPADLEADDSCDADEPAAYDDADEELTEVEATDEVQEPEEEEREVRRPRRRRRRRGRRSDIPAASELESEDLEEEVSEEFSDEEHGDEIQSVDRDSESEDADEEVVLPVSYEGIPTWEEAISYLVIVPPTESRGSYRGRHDSRRDDSRRR
ncbi:hypothetical protein [Schlesneria sp. DSM 10557]|uniref:hypothetical protein n=1 Tax=Schlesneria sp. DSM 10557 TaxID=3044399 RepID=UPI0035A08FB2